MEKFDNDDGAAQRGSQREIQRFQPTLAWPDDAEEQPAQAEATHDLDQRGHEYDSSRAEHFFEVHFQTDEEQKQDQANLCDGFNGLSIGDPTQTVRSDGKAGDQVGDEERLFGRLANHRHHPRGNNAHRDVNNQSVVHVAAGYTWASCRASSAELHPETEFEKVRAVSSRSHYAPRQMKSFPMVNSKSCQSSLVALSLLFCSCSTTSLQQTWKSADFHGSTFKKIAVITVDERALVRETFEGQTATQLEARDQAALRVNELMTIAEMKPNKERAAERLRQAGADAVLIQRLVSRESAGAGVNKAGAPPLPSFDSGSLGWFDYYFVTVPRPTVLSTDLTQDFYIESNLFDLGSERRLWSCTTRTKVKENADWLKLVKPFATTVVEAMAKDGVIR